MTFGSNYSFEYSWASLYTYKQALPGLRQFLLLFLERQNRWGVSMSCNLQVSPQMFLAFNRLRCGFFLFGMKTCTHTGLFQIRFNTPVLWGSSLGLAGPPTDLSRQPKGLSWSHSLRSSLHSILTNLPVSATENLHHSMRLPPPNAASGVTCLSQQIRESLPHALRVLYRPGPMPFTLE